MIWLVVAERLVVTGTAAFALGAIDAGGHDGFSPGGHFDLGATFRQVRIAAELDAGLWAREDVPDDRPESGSYRRVGGALRYYFWDLDVGEASQLRLHLEAGLGRQWIATPSFDVERPDVALGFGMQQQARLGGATLGGNFGIRVLVSEATPPAIACKGVAACESYRRHDLGLFFTMGFAVGR